MQRNSNSRQKVKKFIKEELGEYERRKHWYNFYCPFHHGDSLKFGVDFGTGKYTCFVCGESGSVYDLYREIKEGGIMGASGVGGLLGRTSKSKYEKNSSPALLNRLNDTRPPEPLSNMSPEGLFKRLNCLWDIPYSVSAEMAIKYLVKRGVPQDLHVSYIVDDIPGRIVFPFFMEGKFVYYQARSFTGMSGLKTLNPSEEDGWLTKGKVLWRYDEIQSSKDKTVCITEGIFDSISVLTTTGIQSTPLLGSTISEDQIKLLKKAGTKKVIIFLDKDAASAAADLAILLYKRHFEVSLVMWGDHDIPDKSDPNSIDKLLLEELIYGAYVLHPTSEIELRLEFC